jgi:hypothetical protein
MNRFGRLVYGKTMFLQIDIQERFRTLTYNYNNLAGIGMLMMRASKNMKVPIIVTEQNPKVMLPTDKLITKYYHDGVKVYEKSKFSAYQDTAIKDAITKIAPKSIVVYGLESHVCVMQTALDLLESNYDVHILVDGVSSMKKYDRSCALLKMARAGMNMTTSESALFDLVRGADSPLFKEVLPLIKERNAKNSPVLPIEWE